ncbi:hypothetical protein AS850_02825 [Frondihabitans sp. 762G35]|uniref:hypothetical protein n=1 Tax=Frondihabitans sp. 762G35 TaxID=1446794 RepID=UPI000D2175CB|nr:hypothetical protein [Frondihabitans sp. 762G35]ARC56006.1 hypothetical protein AS850_02825 [Frondihabitans sp. 762G35]
MSATKMTHAKLTLKNGKSFADVVLPFASPAEANIRIRNLDPTTDVYFETRTVALHPNETLTDGPGSLTPGRTVSRLVHDRHYHRVEAGQIETIEEAI